LSVSINDMLCYVLLQTGAAVAFVSGVSALVVLVTDVSDADTLSAVTLILGPRLARLGRLAAVTCTRNSSSDSVSNDDRL